MTAFLFISALHLLYGVDPDSNKVTKEDYLRLESFSKNEQSEKAFDQQREQSKIADQQFQKKMDQDRLSGVGQYKQEKQQEKEFFSDTGPVRKNYLAELKKEETEHSRLYQNYVAERKLFDSQKLKRPISEELELGLISKREKVQANKRRHFESSFGVNLGGSSGDSGQPAFPPTPSSPSRPNTGFSPAPVNPPVGDYYDSNNNNFPPPPPPPMPFDTDSNDYPPPPPPSLYDDDF